VNLTVQYRMLVQPVDATPSNEKMRHYLPWMIDPRGSTPSRPGQGRVWIASMPRMILALETPAIRLGP
jgi:hypothetical protein